jgi:hypothetical protein
MFKTDYTGKKEGDEVEICLYNFIHRFNDEYGKLVDGHKLRKLYVNLLTSLVDEKKWRSNRFKTFITANMTCNEKIIEKNKTDDFPRTLLSEDQAFEDDWKIRARLPHDHDLLTMCRLLLQAQCRIHTAYLDGNHRVADNIKVLCRYNESWPLETRCVNRKDGFKVVNGRVYQGDRAKALLVYGETYSSVQLRSEPVSEVNFHLLPGDAQFGFEGLKVLRLISGAIVNKQNYQSQYDFADSSNKMVLDFMEQARHLPQSKAAQLTTKIIPLLSRGLIPCTMDAQGRLHLTGSDSCDFDFLLAFYTKYVTARELSQRKDFFSGKFKSMKAENLYEVVQLPETTFEVLFKVCSDLHEGNNGNLLPPDPRIPDGQVDLKQHFIQHCTGYDRMYFSRHANRLWFMHRMGILSSNSLNNLGDVDLKDERVEMFHPTEKKQGLHAIELAAGALVFELYQIMLVNEWDSYLKEFLPALKTFPRNKLLDPSVDAVPSCYLTLQKMKPGSQLILGNYSRPITTAYSFDSIPKFMFFYLQFLALCALKMPVLTIWGEIASRAPDGHPERVLCAKILKRLLFPGTTYTTGFKPEGLGDSYLTASQLVDKSEFAARVRVQKSSVSNPHSTASGLSICQMRSSDKCFSVPNYFIF